MLKHPAAAPSVARVNVSSQSRLNNQLALAPRSGDPVRAIQANVARASLAHADRRQLLPGAQHLPIVSDPFVNDGRFVNQRDRNNHRIQPVAPKNARAPQFVSLTSTLICAPRSRAYCSALAIKCVPMPCRRCIGSTYKPLQKKMLRLRRSIVTSPTMRPFNSATISTAPGGLFMFMAIARDKRLAKREHVLVLPPHWSTLYQISRLDARTVRADRRPSPAPWSLSAPAGAGAHLWPRHLLRHWRICVLHLKISLQTDAFEQLTAGSHAGAGWRVNARQRDRRENLTTPSGLAEFTGV